MQKEENIVQEQVKNTEKEKNNNEVQGWGKILGIAVASALLLIGILSLGFGLYRKNKGGK